MVFSKMAVVTQGYYMTGNILILNHASYRELLIYVNQSWTSYAKITVLFPLNQACLVSQISVTGFLQC